MTMRVFMKLFEQFQTEIDEAGAGPSRIVQHIHSGAVFIMLSAMRGNLPHAENLRRTLKLKRMLEGLPVSYIETEGEYQEDGRSEPSPEASFFVMPRKGNAKLTAEPFRQFGVKLMHAFDQDSILYGDGTTAQLIFGDGDTMEIGDTMTFRPEIIANLGGFSKIKGRKFSFTDQPTAGKGIGAMGDESGDDEAVPPAKTRGTIYGTLAAALNKSKDKDPALASKKIVA